ncbi:hypothetical protein EJ03DRAFT_323351, partial [Teratosphaeria nubilosa]
SNKRYNEATAAKDNIARGVYEPSPAGTAAFFGLRTADLFLQHGILSHNRGASLISRLGGGVLPQGPPLVTNTPFDRLGLSPYRAILFAMAVGSTAKQNFWLLAINNEQMTPGRSVLISAFNSAFNSINSLLFITSQTSASVNGEHFPQTPLIVGSTLYVTGLFIEWFSEVQRAAWKRKPENKGQVYEGGLFGLSRHINYLGYTLWRTGYSLAAGGWTWGGIVAAVFTYDFTQRGIPVLQKYLEDKYADKYEHYKQTVPYAFVPFVW